MLEGYKPIDFGNMFSSQPGLGQIRNKVGLSQAALNILESSTWNKTPVATLLENGLTATGETPKRQQTLWGRVTDALSIPAYAIANAADDAIAGHQSSDTDSVLHDVGQVIGGIVTGAGRGIGTGFRGAFAGSETAADPMDKIYLGDALIRLDTHMSAEDAMKPENLEKVRARLANKKINQFSDDPKDKYFYNFDTGKVEVSDEDIQQYFKDMQMYGLGASMVGDPINFVSGGAKIANITKGAKDTAEVFDASKLANFNKGLPKSVDIGSFGKADGSYKVVLPPGKIQQQVVSDGQLVRVPDWFDFPANPVRTAGSTGPLDITNPSIAEEALKIGESSPVAKNQIDPFEPIINQPATGIGSPSKVENSILGKRRSGLIPEVKVPVKQLRIAYKLSQPENITKLTGDLLHRIATNNFDNASERLKVLYPGIHMERTQALIEHFRGIPNFIARLNNGVERRKIVGAFNRVIFEDAKSLGAPPKITPAAEVINAADKTTGPVGLQRLVEAAKGTPPVASKNPTRDAQIVDDLINTYKGQLDLTTVPAGINNPEKYRAAMQRHGAYTGPKQVNIWNALTSKYLKNAKTPKRFEKALSLLKLTEDKLSSMGHIPMSSVPKHKSSSPLKLSSVIEAIGPAAAAMNKTLLTKILRGDREAMSTLPAEVVQRIEDMRAGEAIVDGDKMLTGIDHAKPNIDELIKGPLSAADTADIVTTGSKVAEDITKAAGGSPVAGQKAAQYIKESYIPKAPGDGFSTFNTTAIMSSENTSARIYKRFSNLSKINHDIAQVLGITPKQAGKLIGPRAMVIEWIGARFNAAYKNADMRPIYLREAATAKSTVARRAQYLNNLAKRFDVNDVDLWNDALKGAQGRQAPLPGTPAAELSKEVLAIMRDLFGSSGLRESVALENSVVGRSQLLMGELNKNLRRFGLGQYKFVKKDEYADGVKWLNSWESWEIEKPLEFLFKVQNVVEHTVREKNMFDDIISRFASPKKMGEFQHSINHPRLQGYYFGKNAADQGNHFVRMLKDISTPNSKPMQNFDKVLSKWKASVTIYVPSHHIRNMIGDVYFNWLAGVNSSRPYSLALNVMRAQKGRYNGLEAISQLTNPNALRQVIEGKGYTAAGKRTALTMRNGTHVTNDMVYVSAFQQGILPTTRVLEDIPDDAISGLDKFRPLGGRGQKAAHSISEGRDHYVRLAHFINELKKSPKSFEEAVQDAAATVRKWHPDGMDLTKFERNVMRRVMPFYSWTRKAFPLILESLVATPGKVMAIPKGQYFLANAMGIQTGPMSDPFPYDQLFPDWIREKGVAPIFGGPGDYTVVNPGNPSMDIISQLNHPGKMTAGLLNPGIRIPIEGMTGTDTQTGAPVDITSTDYIAKQLPGVSHVGRATGEFGVSDTTKGISNGVNMQNIANMLFGLGYQNTGPYQKSAQFDLRDYLKSIRRQP
ncbi:hypothetical protein [Streptomyces anandii]|uniref:hypothetical protein n=1 Tax=Streptomyces anandii TaxID=285454 RepID=UPI0036B8651B